LRETQERLDRRIANIYRYGSINILDVLMDTSDLSDFLSTCDMLAKVSEQDRNDVEQVKMLKAQIEEAKDKLANDKASHEALVAQLASEKSEIEAGLAERQSMLASVEGEIAALAQQQQAARVAAFQDNSAASYGGGEGSYGPAPAPHAGGVVGIAMQYLGVPYVWGGASPAGFDCSGLVMYVYAQVGIYLPHSAAAQYAAGTPISYGELAPGDLVFFGSGGISHVGIYIGGGSMIHAPFEGEVVQIAPVSAGGAYRGACRL
jgi:cell wall-associated NlpC family hydrolase